VRRALAFVHGLAVDVHRSTFSIKFPSIVTTQLLDLCVKLECNQTNSGWNAWTYATSR
jgi:hypothetical protein